MKARKGHHLLEGILIKDKKKVRKSFDFDRLALFWQLKIGGAPWGESLSECNKAGTRLYINKDQETEELTVSPVGKIQDYLDSVFLIEES